VAKNHGETENIVPAVAMISTGRRPHRSMARPQIRAAGMPTMGPTVMNIR
jgi:hypothetical protein